MDLHSTLQDAVLQLKNYRTHALSGCAGRSETHENAL